MNPPDLLTICGSAFVAVFALLTFLAGVMRILITLLPERAAGGIDAATLAAVSAAATHAFPGTSVTKVEEIK